jgi:hypothetical protein
MAQFGNTAHHAPILRLQLPKTYQKHIKIHGAGIDTEMEKKAKGIRRESRDRSMPANSKEHDRVRQPSSLISWNDEAQLY